MKPWLKPTTFVDRGIVHHSRVSELGVAFVDFATIHSKDKSGNWSLLTMQSLELIVVPIL